MFVKHAIAGAILSPLSYTACSLALGQGGNITVTSLAKKAIGGAVIATGFQAAKAFAIVSFELNLALTFNLTVKVGLSAGITGGKIALGNCDALDILFGL